MNPFLHNSVATVQASPVRVIAPQAQTSRPSRWPRAIGTLALAAGLSLATMPVQALDVNTATVEQLRGIRGLGPKTAEIIVKERERGGRFESMEDLSDRVRGIGMRRAQALEAAGLRVDRGALPVAGRGESRAAGISGATLAPQATTGAGQKGKNPKTGAPAAR